MKVMEKEYTAIICTGCFKDVSGIVYEKAIELFGAKITNIVEGVTNDCYSFMIVPDGSKKGRDTYNTWVTKRDTFISYIKNCTDNLDMDVAFVEINFGKKI